MSATVVRQKPLMTMRQILLMNLGFFGIQYSFGMQQTAVNPIYTMLGANPEEMPLLNLAGPITGLLVQPMIGAISDKTWVPKWGRRRPFLLIGAIGCSIGLFLFPFASAVWIAVLLLWLLDVSNNTAMEPYRAFISDKLPPSQLAKGFLAQSFFTGLGITLANVSLFIFKALLGESAMGNGIYYWVMSAFMLGTVASLATVLISVLSTKEIEPSPEELAEIRRNKLSFGGAVKEIWDALLDMPVQLRKLALVYLFQWYAMNCYWQYVSLSVAKSAFNTTDTKSSAYADAVAWTGLVNGGYNVVTFCVAFALVAMAKRYGAKYVHTGCLFLAALGLAFFPHITDKYLLFVPIIGLGIAWASIMGVPYIMAVRMVPSTRYGVYMGIINMMIVIPMLIQTITFGTVYRWIGDDPGHAITFAAVFLALAGVAMLWIKEPPIVKDVDDLSVPAPAGH
ncbi:MFS transporter [Arachnia propionica]|uniref:MFS transporter n=1 Tax=Arachnia propionica TaxID=1750 RepID=A0A3P1WPN0_9ACTN|nr:MFS transporter [Arachnia propionica]RRD48554.1 MFS transporter [Arachnia propionica]